MEQLIKAVVELKKEGLKRSTIVKMVNDIYFKAEEEAKLKITKK